MSALKSVLLAVWLVASVLADTAPYAATQVATAAESGVYAPQVDAQYSNALADEKDKSQFVGAQQQVSAGNVEEDRVGQGGSEGSQSTLLL